MFYRKQPFPTQNAQVFPLGSFAVYGSTQVGEDDKLLPNESYCSVIQHITKMTMYINMLILQTSPTIPKPYCIGSLMLYSLQPYGTLHKKLCKHCKHKCTVLHVVMLQSNGEAVMKASPTLQAKCTSKLMFKQKPYYHNLTNYCKYHMLLTKEANLHKHFANSSQGQFPWTVPMDSSPPA